MDGQTVNLSGALGLLRRRYVLILVCFAVLMAVLIGAVSLLPAAYTASVLVYVDPSHKDLLEPQDAADDANADSARVDSEVEIMTAESVLLQVARDLHLADDPAFQPAPGWREWLMALVMRSNADTRSTDETQRAVLKKLQSSVSVQRRGQTYVAAIMVTTGRPQLAAQIANAVAKTYIQIQVSSKIEAVISARNILEDRVVQASAEVAAADGAFDDYIAANVEDIAQATGRGDLLDLRNDLTQHLADATRLSALVQQAGADIARRDYASVSNLLHSGPLQTMTAQRQALADQLATAPASARSDLQNRLDAMDAAMERSARSELAQVKSQLASAQSASSDIRIKLRGALLDGNLPASVLTGIYGLQQRAEIARNQYQRLLARSKDLEGQAYLQVADSRIVSLAVAPDDPSSPGARLLLVIGAAGALTIGVLAALLAENVLGGFISAEQLKSVLRLEHVATVPVYRPLPRPSDPKALSPADAVVGAPLSSFSEGMRRVRLGIDHALQWRAPEKASGGAVVMVTSAEASEGKTVTALSLARAYAMSNRTVLLIDCDLRKPGLHQHLGMDRPAGLMDYLIDNGQGIDFASILVPDPQSAVQVALGTGRSDMATDHFLTTPAFLQLIDHARRAFDVIILDTPPVGPVVDGLYLTHFCDAVVFITKWAATAQRDVRNALLAIQATKPPSVPVLTVLVQQQLPAFDRRRRYAGYYAD